ncbi:SDR family NAD(P)-dependent oxidoreductase [Actinomadura sp. B10D3]|uniref:SDR family NAD(P)-dependent oxidoreductase n=1 Tax=Actinomadura sp. B10D3 TaxID=3153557 RepID=UPI00325D06A1
MRIKGSVAVVTGAGSGLGAAVAVHLAGMGATVVGADKDLAAAKRVLSGSPGARAVEADVTDPASVGALVAAAGEPGPLRVVVNCAGGGLPPARTVRRDGSVQPLEPWRDVIELNLVAAYDVTRQAAAMMADAPPEDESRGVIVHISSIAGLDGSQGVSAYAASKGALAALVHSTARDLSVFGIRVVAVAPGPFDTPSYAALPDQVRERRRRDFVHPKRPGRPAEFSAFVQHLIENEYLNAECFRIDAGLRMHE